ncbi:hypothetical protein VARIO8X_60294 [Burkholderiales bacterium 8X]|nr:hypothetical protein VARIO8X_60294 [Burkholderiales bacterium 8X]
MTLSHRYQAASSLSPNAARLAVRMLDGAPGIPFDWRFALSIVLNERAASAGELSSSDFMTLTQDRQRPEQQSALVKSLEQAEAQAFMRDVREALARRAPRSGLLPNRTDAGPATDRR